MSKPIFATIVVFALTTSALRAQNSPPLQAAKIRYQQALQRGGNPELARQKYLDQLVEIRSGWPRTQADKDFDALDTEVSSHPLPENTSSAKSHRLLVGRWRSPRHDYLYRANGTWTMLPAREYGIQAPHGTWRVDGRYYFDKSEGGPSETKYTILLLDRKNFVFTDGGEFPFYEKRLSP